MIGEQILNSVWRRTRVAMALTCAAVLLAVPAHAQDTTDPATRAAVLEQAQADKAKELHPYVPNKAEKYLNYAETTLSTQLAFHPYFDSAYSGGGFTLGAGYRSSVGDYNSVDVRGSLTFSGYKRIESEFLAPRLFHRQGMLSLIGGWREATQVGYYGSGTAN